MKRPRVLNNKKNDDYYEKSYFFFDFDGCVRCECIGSIVERSFG